MNRSSVIVRWDVALDLHRVRYRLYYSSTPFNFTTDPQLRNATRVDLIPDPGNGYIEGVDGAYPYEARVNGLEPGVTYYFVLRAHDLSPNRNEEMNTQVVTAVMPR